MSSIKPSSTSPVQLPPYDHLNRNQRENRRKAGRGAAVGQTGGVNDRATTDGERRRPAGTMLRLWAELTEVIPGISIPFDVILFTSGRPPSPHDVVSRPAEIARPEGGAVQHVAAH